MSVDQYQRTVNSLDKEIASLEKKKAAADKKAADEQKKAASVTISKNASASTIKSKMSEIQRHEAAARKAAEESADWQKKIADRRAKRNDAYTKLQKEQQAEKKKEKKQTDQMLMSMQRKYESRINELEKQSMPMMVRDEYREAEKEYDVFVSHASEDKADFVDELVREMKNRDIKVWYDTSEMRWGDSLRKRIDDGLKRSRFGIVVLSPSYIADEKYWTKAELDGLFQQESIGRTLLPIWHNLTKKQVMEFSPMIASKKALTTATMTPEEIAEEMKKLLSEDEEA
ncbi:MAG: toll/interleukin-1 receptor domain-containing protein [Clostridia bacterium]|nr:toll/interleukin-1 receptor domain-containing protein [Clostridia bacterium]